MNAVDDYIIYFFKLINTCLCSMYIFKKITKLKFNSIKPIFIFSIVTFFTCIICIIFVKLFITSIYSNLLLFSIISICLYFIFKIDIGYTMLANLISFSIHYFSYCISVAIAFPIERVFDIDNKFIIICVIISIQQLLLYLIFKIKRFKNGFQFLKEEKKNNYINLIFISITSIIIYLYSLATFNIEISNNSKIIYTDRGTVKYFYLSLIFFAFIIFLMIKESITLSYKQKLLENTLSDYEKQIKEKDEKVQKLSDEKFRISKLNHEFYNRQEALLLKVENTLSNMNFETAEEFDLKDKIKSLSNEYTKKLNENKLDSNLTKTNIEEIDDMFTYMNSECRKNGIEFILQVNGNINHLINNYIDKAKLVTLIGDHLRDAIIAVNYSSNNYKSILSILGIKDENYEFCIYDSGIEFQIETYNKLCIEPATTHKDNGGTGIGFITTFETLKETKASLIIEELNELKENSYTKAIRFIFDNKNEFNIISYREELLKEKVNSDIFKIKTKNTD